MNLILLRHGEIPSNIKKVYAGKSSEHLSINGIQQARDVSLKLADIEIDAIYTSPIYRAVQTAEIIKDCCEKEPKYNDSFRELEMGLWEGLSEAEIASNYPAEWHIWNNSPAKLKLPGRETLDELLKRVLAGIYKINQQEYRNYVVIVTHVAIIRVLLLWHSKKDLNLYKTIHVPNAEIFKLKLNVVFG